MYAAHVTVGFIGRLLFSGVYVYKRKMTSKTDQLMKEIDTVEFQERCSNLLKLLNDAKQRQVISEYKRLHKLLTGQEVEIYTDPSGERLIPKDHDPNKDAEFWFDFKDQGQPRGTKMTSS